MVHETPKKIPQPRSYHPSSNDRIRDIFIKHPESQFTSTKTMIIIDSMSEERSSIGTFEKIGNFEDSVRHSHENVIICQDDLVKIDDDGKLNFDRTTKINSCKDNFDTNPSKINKTEKCVPKTVAKEKIRKKRRSCKRIIPDTSSGEENNSPVMQYFGLNPKKFIDLIDDVFDSSTEEFSKEYVEPNSIRTTPIAINSKKPPEPYEPLKNMPNIPVIDDLNHKEAELGSKNSVVDIIQNIREKIQILSLENSEVLKDVIGTDQNSQIEKKIKDTCSCLHCNHKMHTTINTDFIPATCHCPGHVVSYSCPAHCMDIFSGENVAPNYRSNPSSECTSSSSLPKSSPRFQFSQTPGNVSQREPLPSERYKNIKKLLAEDNRISKTINSIYESAKQYDKHHKDDTCLQRSYEDDRKIQMAAEKFLKSVEKQRVMEHRSPEISDFNETHLICTQSSATVSTSRTNSSQNDAVLLSSNQLLCTNSEASSPQDGTKDLLSSSIGDDLYLSSIEYHISRLKYLGTNPSKTSLTSNEKI